MFTKTLDMKTITFGKWVSFIVALFLVVNVSAQTTEKTEKTQEQVKTGWNLGALPVISFDSDLGFQYGALMNLYNYGDGSEYPNYRQSLYAEISRFTKKSGIYRVNYNTKDLIEGIRVYFDLSYMPDQAYSFYGFNGYDAVYDSAWENTNGLKYKSRVFYRYQRKFFRMKADFQGHFKNEKLHWVAGVGFYKIDVARVDIDLLNKGKTEDLLPDDTTLYDHYIAWKIIPKSEKDGGTFTVFKAGLEYDSRDNEANPNKGVWDEVVLASAPKFSSNMDDGFLKLSFTHRQYITLIKNRLTFAYRIGGQFTLSGHTPFYAEPLMFFARSTAAYNEGLGGSKTMRGILRNRIVGDGVMYGNFEFRWKFVKFHLINQNFYLALNTFFDSGKVIQKTDITQLPLNNYFVQDAEGLHNSWGVGFRIAMNQNFIIAVDHGQAMDPQDGLSGTYVGLNFMF
jgi:hypothetical protein